MAFRTVYTPLYRDADESGRVGTLGLLAMLQESVLGHAAALGLDHDDLVRTRGIGWMFARYRLAVACKAAVRAPVTSPPGSTRRPARASSTTRSSSSRTDPSWRRAVWRAASTTCAPVP